MGWIKAMPLAIIELTIEWKKPNHKGEAAQVLQNNFRCKFVGHA